VDLGNEDSIFYKEGMIDHFDQCGINENPEEPMRNIELMKTVSDMLRLEKNVCLARNFPNLTKERKKYVDVWLIDFFAKPNFIVSNPGRVCEKMRFNLFSNFSCMFLNPNNFFQFQF
jgi:hypothetical protein